MKTLLSITAFCCLTLPVRSQTAETKPNPPTLRQALVSFTWGWLPGVIKDTNTEIRFYKDGVATNPKYWVGTWEVTGLRTVTVVRPHRTQKGKMEKAFLTFDPTFSTFDGIYFTHGRVSGGRKAPADPEATLTTKPK